LERHYRQGYTYIEVGDGDELWKNRRLSPIVRAHRPVYDLLHEFHTQDRLHLIVGNHDYADPRPRVIAKDGMPTRKGLVLRHAGSGRELLVTHGHQADFERDPGLVVSRLGVRHFWRALQTRGYWRNPDWTEMVQGPSWLGRTIARNMLKRNQIVEGRLYDWAHSNGPALLTGHTHVARFAAPRGPAFYNTGCCIVPGEMTGLLLQQGQLSLVRWTEDSHVTSELLAGPRLLADV
jgi:UDP-2,3-diacylglucosamine pyrophosphatase LpxH